MSSDRLRLDFLGILQTGDIGAFGRESVLDKATRKFAAKDPSELGAFDYIDGTKRAAFPTWFVRGNHDDPEFLASHRSLDPYGDIRQLPDGEVNELPSGILVASLGGIEPGGGPPRSPLKTRGRMRPEPADQLLSYSGPRVDVLLCHDGPPGFCLEDDGVGGSELVGLVVEHLSPRFVLFGHYSHPPRPRKVRDTWVVPVNQRDVLRVPRRDGGVGVLDSAESTFFFLSTDGNSLVRSEDVPTRASHGP